MSPSNNTAKTTGGRGEATDRPRATELLTGGSSGSGRQDERSAHDYGGRSMIEQDDERRPTPRAERRDDAPRYEDHLGASPKATASRNKNTSPARADVGRRRSDSRESRASRWERDDGHRRAPSQDRHYSGSGPATASRYQGRGPARASAGRASSRSPNNYRPRSPLSFPSSSRRENNYRPRSRSRSPARWRRQHSRSPSLTRAPSVAPPGIPQKRVANSWQNDSPDESAAPKESWSGPLPKKRKNKNKNKKRGPPSDIKTYTGAATQYVPRPPPPPTASVPVEMATREPDRPAGCDLSDHDRGYKANEAEVLKWVSIARQHEEESRNYQALVRHLQGELAAEMWAHKADKEHIKPYLIGVKTAFIDELAKAYAPQREIWRVWGESTLNPIEEDDDDPRVTDRRDGENDVDDVEMNDYLKGTDSRIPREATLANALSAANEAAAAAAAELSAAGSPVPYIASPLPSAVNTAPFTANVVPERMQESRDVDDGDGLQQLDYYVPPDVSDFLTPPAAESPRVDEYKRFEDGQTFAVAHRGNRDREEIREIFGAIQNDEEQQKRFELVTATDDDLRKVKLPLYEASCHAFVWDMTDGYTLPLPLGKRGHPFRKGWMWEDFDTKRLFETREEGARLSDAVPQFAQLAREARTLPFGTRSMTQRLVVSWALRDKLAGPAGWEVEPDIMFECRSNPLRVSSAVRCQSAYNPQKQILYTEWDIIDLDNLVMMRMSQPTKEAMSAMRELDENASWPEMLVKAIDFGTRNGYLFTNVKESANGPQRYKGTSNLIDIFCHLLKCGLSRRRMIAPKTETAKNGDGEFKAFVDRLNEHERDRKKLTEDYLAELEKLGRARNQVEERVWVDCRLRHYAIEAGRPLMRTKITLPEGAKVFFGADGYVRAMSTPPKPKEVKEQHKQRQQRKKQTVNVHSAAGEGPSSRPN